MRYQNCEQGVVVTGAMWELVEPRSGFLTRLRKILWRCTVGMLKDGSPAR